MSDEQTPEPDSEIREPDSRDDSRSEEYPTMVYPPPGASLPGDDDSGTLSDEDVEWVPLKTTGFRLEVPVAVLAAVILVALGFWGGAALERSHGGASAASGLASLASRLRSAERGATTGTTGTTTTAASGFSGFGGFGASSAAASGTISVVDGDTLYVLTSAGTLVKVTIGKTTTLTRNADTTAIGLRPGDSVVVEGTTASNGTVSATSVSATAPGVSSSSGYGGFGGEGDSGFGGSGSSSSASR